MSLFTYEIAPPTNVVEASASPEPDDISKAYIRIEATPIEDKDIKEGDISEIRFEINVLSNPNGSVDDKNRELLTRNPGNITPVAAAFQRWTFKAPSEKNIFVARPDAVTDEAADDQTLVKAGEVLAFYLYDIEVIDRDGETKIKVTEVDGDGNEIQDAIPDLAIRKVFPALRIDFFKADKLAVKAGTQVQLEWASTSATKILLSGITQADIALSGNPTALKDPSLDGFQILETNLPGQQVAQKDGNFFVRPETTTTYTLQASSNNVDTVALQQLTITVKGSTIFKKRTISLPFIRINEDGFGNTRLEIGNLDVFDWEPIVVTCSSLSIFVTISRVKRTPEGENSRMLIDIEFLDRWKRSGETEGTINFEVFLIRKGLISNNNEN